MCFILCGSFVLQHVITFVGWYWCYMAYVCCDMIISIIARLYHASWLVAIYIGNGAHYNLWWLTVPGNYWHISSHLFWSIQYFFYSFHMEDIILRFIYHLRNVPLGFSYHAAMKFEVEFEEGNMPWWWTSKSQCIMQELTHTTSGPYIREIRECFLYRKIISQYK